MKSNTPEWREFEELVARIERTASPLGATVKSPDRIRDLVTGRLREVDASIRARVGTADLLITVECRRRSRRDDDTWIEQLATKRQKIGAAKTIAVSAKGFTAAALETAKRVGIEARVLSQVSPADIEGWFLAGGAVHVFRLIENIRCFLVLYEDSGVPSKYGFWLPDVEKRVLYHEDDPPLAARDYIPILEATHPQLCEGVPLDMSKVELEFPIQWGAGELYLGTTSGRLPVYFTRLVAEISYQYAVCDIGDGVHHEYAAPGGLPIQHTQFETELFGLPVTFEHQADPSGTRSVACRFGPKGKGGLELRQSGDAALARPKSSRPASPSGAQPEASSGQEPRKARFRR